MVKVRETMVKVTCSACGRRFELKFKDWKAEMETQATRSERRAGKLRPWYCPTDREGHPSTECLNEGRKRSGLNREGVGGRPRKVAV